MARVVDGFDSFTSTSARLFTSGMTHTCQFAFPDEAGPQLPTPEQ